MILSGWGRFPRQDCRVTRPRGEAGLKDLVAAGGLIARGNGRAYGDSALSRRNTVDMRGFNRLLAFDPESGRLTAEAGVLLQDVISVFLPRGWFPAVTPGTKYVTLGGMIAADVHGKNHHKDGSFGAFVDWIDVMGRDGEVRRCSRDREAELFGWTLGGMGLTGVILRAAFRLRPVDSAWIRQTAIPTANLAETMKCFSDHRTATYAVAWVDCLAGGGGLGRSLVLLGEHARREELPAKKRQAPYAVPARRRLSLPFEVPDFLLNSLTLRAFNTFYYHRGRQGAGERLVDWDSFFYPLDSLLGWNRIYGRRGFAQFQCVLPLERSQAGLSALLEATSRAGRGSFLAVLKRLGRQESRISFPMEGYTLALDFPISPGAQRLLAELDRIAIDHGGRFYLAKDGRMPAQTLHRADPRAEIFRARREGLGLAEVFASAQSERLRL
ncbi:FAD-binding oxidoreductase [Pelagibius sp. CAU 1746]|uniref:FAD-binding oxidoreductase n=1 Tax=Pelagibius sp. CAU 1746 TaxID=3140370 RepID=UPI00325A9ADE